MKITTTKTRHSGMYPRIFIVHGPGLVLRDQLSWRNWNCIAVRLQDRVVWFEVRR